VITIYRLNISCNRSLRARPSADCRRQSWGCTRSPKFESLWITETHAHSRMARACATLLIAAIALCSARRGGVRSFLGAQRQRFFESCQTREEVCRWLSSNKRGGLVRARAPVERAPHKPAHPPWSDAAAFHGRPRSSRHVESACASVAKRPPGSPGSCACECSERYVGLCSPGVPRRSRAPATPVSRGRNDPDKSTTDSGSRPPPGDSGEME